jgi:hypothetical protein
MLRVYLHSAKARETASPNGAGDAVDPRMEAVPTGKESI